MAMPGASDRRNSKNKWEWIREWRGSGMEPEHGKEIVLRDEAEAKIAKLESDNKTLHETIHIWEKEIIPWLPVHIQRRLDQLRKQ
jgi:hypothetical protein